MLTAVVFRLMYFYLLFNAFSWCVVCEFIVFLRVNVFMLHALFISSLVALFSYILRVCVLLVYNF